MAGKKKTRILVVDDEPAIRELLSDALSGEDLCIETAAGGYEAIDMARRNRPDLVIADLMLGDCTGLDVIDSLRNDIGDIPAIVITGVGDPEVLTEASRYRPVELMTKPLDLDRLREIIRAELARQAGYERARKRTRRLRRLARKINIERKTIQSRLDSTCADLTAAYRALSGQMSMQQMLIAYQRDLISARTDDDVFRSLFRLVVHRSGAVSGVALVCDADAELQVAGRFGVPHPDDIEFCHALAQPIINAVLTDPRCMLMDAGEKADLFDHSIRRFLPGLSILAVPLIPVPGELIGLVLMYRKGEQPFTDADVTLAEMIAPPTAAAVRRND